MEIKNSDIIAEFLKHNKIKYVFGIIGSANSYIFDSINKLGYTTKHLRVKYFPEKKLNTINKWTITLQKQL